MTAPSTGSALPVAGAPAVRAEVARLLRRHRGRLAVCGLLVLLVAAPSFAMPLLVRDAIDLGVRGADTGALARSSLGLVVVAVVAAAAGVALAAMSAVVAEDVLAELRGRAVRRLLRRTVREVTTGDRGDAVSRLTGDIELLGTAARSGVPDVVRALALLVFANVALLTLSPALGLVAFAGVPVAALLARRFSQRSTPVYAALRARTGDTVGRLAESFGAARLTRAAGRQRDVEHRHATVSGHVLTHELAAMRLRNRFYPLLELIQVLATVAVLAAGVLLVLAERSSAGVVAGAVLAVASVYGPVEELSDWFDELLSARAALARVVGLLELPPGLAEPEHPVAVPTRGRLAATDLTFAYHPDRPVLTGVELHVDLGEQVALVGATGAGKSTLARLLARQDDPTAGQVTLGGVDLRDARLDDVRRQVLLLVQEGHLVAGSLRDNVRLAVPDAPDEQVAGALDLVGAGRWAGSLPDGLSTDLTAHGSRLSAGQRQLVALARVALADPAVVVLDEATSALDPGTERTVQQALGRVLDGRAVLVIAHRPTTAERADRVAVLEHGRVVQTGPHAALLGVRGPYAALWASWKPPGG